LGCGAAQLVLKNVGFEGGDAAEAPAGGGEGVNEFIFERADGVIRGSMGGDQFL